MVICPSPLCPYVCVKVTRFFVRFYLRIVNDAQVDEEILMIALRTSLTTAPIDPTDAVDFVEQLTQRAARAAVAPYWNGNPTVWPPSLTSYYFFLERNDTPIRITRYEAIDQLFDTVVYRPPPNLLPKE